MAWSSQRQKEVLPAKICLGYDKSVSKYSDLNPKKGHNAKAFHTTITNDNPSIAPTKLNTSTIYEIVQEWIPAKGKSAAAFLREKQATKAFNNI